MTDKSETATKRRPHWAACRKADIKHKRRSFWRVPHDRERVLLSYWYSEDGPLGESEFDVRDLPGYTPADRVDFQSGSIAAWYKVYDAKEKEHHAAIIRACVDDGVDIAAVALATALRVEEEEKERARLSSLPTAFNPDRIPL